MNKDYREDLVKTVLEKFHSVSNLIDTHRIDADFQCFEEKDLYPMIIGSFCEIKNILADALIPMLFDEDGLYIQADLKLLEAPQLDFDISHRMVLRAETKIEKVERRPVVIKYVSDFSEIPKDYQNCTFCGGYTKNDARGHCYACGGPRKW
jgi:hypothetical protein